VHRFFSQLSDFGTVDFGRNSPLAEFGCALVDFVLDQKADFVDFTSSMVSAPLFSQSILLVRK
jgi:hypothetical protein